MNSMGFEQECSLPRQDADKLHLKGRLELHPPRRSGHADCSTSSPGHPRRKRCNGAPPRFRRGRSNALYRLLDPVQRFLVPCKALPKFFNRMCKLQSLYANSSTRSSSERFLVARSVISFAQQRRTKLTFTLSQ